MQLPPRHTSQTDLCLAQLSPKSRSIGLGLRVLEHEGFNSVYFAVFDLGFLGFNIRLGGSGTEGWIAVARAFQRP